MHSLGFHDLFPFRLDGTPAYEHRRDRFGWRYPEKFSLSGRMDVQGTAKIDLKYTSMNANQRAVIVDMSGVEFLGSIGIRTILLSAKAVSQKGGKTTHLNPNPDISKVLEMAGISTLIPISRSLDEARKLVLA
jgi:anti-anti-sigma factor